MSPKTSDDNRDWVAEYEELTKGSLLNEPDKDQREEEFLERVLGKELKHWMDRGGRYGYGLCYDEDGEVIDDWPEED